MLFGSRYRHRLAAGTLLSLAVVLAAPVAAKDVPHGWSALRGSVPKASAPEAATGCEAFGPGFKKMDGTDSCIRVSGSVQVEGRWSTGGASFSPDPARR